MERYTRTNGSSFLALLENLNRPELYCEFKRYLLSKNALIKNGFPVNSKVNPGQHKSESVEKTTERKCCRCKNVFIILPDGQYVSDTVCCFHTQKKINKRGYLCCGRFDFSKGCATWPYHVSDKTVFHNTKFITTKKTKNTNTTFGRVFAIDCEMCYTTVGLELTKIGVLNLDGVKVFESFVVPKNPILDYNTMYSGVTENDLRSVTTTLEDVQAYLLKIINKDSILVGHSLENDLKALRLIHDNVVDTSVVFPHEKFPGKYKMSLKFLASKYLKKDIQSSYGHDCMEDAKTCLELMYYKIHSDIKSRLPPLACFDGEMYSDSHITNSPLIMKETTERDAPISKPCSSYENGNVFVNTANDCFQYIVPGCMPFYLAEPVMQEFSELCVYSPAPFVCFYDNPSSSVYY